DAFVLASPLARAAGSALWHGRRAGRLRPSLPQRVGPRADPIQQEIEQRPVKPAQRRDEYRNSPQPHPPRERHACHAIKRSGPVNAGSVTKSSHSCEQPPRSRSWARLVAGATLLVDPGSRTLPRRDILPAAMPRRPGTTAAPPTEALASPVRDFVVPLIAAAVRAPVGLAVNDLGVGVVDG